MKYAILNATGTAVREIREYDVLPPHRPGMVRPLVSTPVPPHNLRTHQATLGYAIAPTQVTETWTVTQRPSILPVTWSSYEFLNRFTSVERKLIWARSKTDDDIADFLMLSQAAQEVTSNDPATIAGMDLLVSKNILTAARKDAILNGA